MHSKPKLKKYRANKDVDFAIRATTPITKVLPYKYIDILGTHEKYQEFIKHLKNKDLKKVLKREPKVIKNKHIWCYDFRTYDVIVHKKDPYIQVDDRMPTYLLSEMLDMLLEEVK